MLCTQFGYLRLCEPYCQLNKRQEAFGGYNPASEQHLEKQAHLMLRGMIAHKKQFLCPELINLGRPTDPSRRLLKVVAAGEESETEGEPGMAEPAKTATAGTRQAEAETVRAAEEWEDGESDWDEGAGWLPPSSPGRTQYYPSEELTP